MKHPMRSLGGLAVAVGLLGCDGGEKAPQSTPPAPAPAVSPSPGATPTGPEAVREMKPADSKPDEAKPAPASDAAAKGPEAKPSDEPPPLVPPSGAKDERSDASKPK